MLKNLIYLLKIAATAILIWFLLSKIDLPRFFSEMRNVDIDSFLLAVLLSGIGWWINSLRWGALLEIFNVKIKSPRLFLYNLVGIFYGIVLPGGKITGDLVRAYQIARDHRGEREMKNQIFLLSFVDVGMGLLGYVIFAGIFFIIGHPSINYLGSSSFIIGAILLLMAVLGLGFIFSNLFDFLIKIFVKIPLASLRKFLVFVLSVLITCRKRKYQLLKSLSLSLIGVLSGAAALYVISEALGLGVGFWTIVFFNSLVIILITIPITIAGIGLREGGLIYLLVQTGLASERAAALSFLNLFMIMALASLGGLWEFYYHFLKRRGKTRITTRIDTGTTHIGIFSLAYIPFVGGAELAVKEITDRLLQHRFTCFTHRFNREWPRQEKIGNVEVVRVGQSAKCQVPSAKNYYGHFWQKALYVFRAWRAAEKLHKQQPFDAIWAMMAAYGGLAALLFKLRHPRVPMLLTLQEGDSEGHILRRVGIFYPLWRLIFKKADYIQTISNYLADFARRHGARCPIEVVPNGVDIKSYENTKKYESTKKEKIIITTSRLVHKNGIDTLIRAAAELKALTSNSKFTIQILGGGPEEENLKKLAIDLKIQDQVEFLGHVDPERIPDYLAKADIFVRPSRSEGLGSSFLEAMAAGLPIIGTPVGGIPDFLKEGETGFFCRVDDPVDLAEKIKLLLTDADLRQKISQAGRALVVKNYSWDIIAGKMNKIFTRLCAF